MMIQDVPPDAPNRQEPKQYLGKTLESQNCMKANLLFLGACQPVSRSKPFKEGGDDIRMRDDIPADRPADELTDGLTNSHVDKPVDKTLLPNLMMLGLKIRQVIKSC